MSDRPYLIKAINRATGEIIELPATNPQEIVTAWQTAQEYEKAAKSLKDQLKKLVPAFVGTRGVSEPIGNFQFRVSSIQRMNYDKAVMRETLDADLFDVLIKPDKPAIDKYLKENLESLGDVSTRLRQAMIPEGKPYEVIKLEKISTEGGDQ